MAPEKTKAVSSACETAAQSHLKRTAPSRKMTMRTGAARLCLALLLAGLLGGAVTASAATDLSRAMLAYTFSQAATEFYRKTGDQALLDGVVAGLRSAIKQHGGDPASIAFCEEIDLDYVSCSPYRVPVARLAASQAALGIGGCAGFALGRGAATLP